MALVEEVHRDAGGAEIRVPRARTPGDPVRPVEVVKEGPPRSHKVKVRRLDGEYEGLEEWVPEVRLGAPWEEAEELLEYERRMFEALDASGDVYGTVPYEAVRMVLLALSSSSRGRARRLPGLRDYQRELLDIEDLDAAAEQLDLQAEDMLAKVHAYADHFGRYKAPPGMAVEVAKHCCERFTLIAGLGNLVPSG